MIQKFAEMIKERKSIVFFGGAAKLQRKALQDRDTLI